MSLRPLWRCRNCAAEWPCQPARLALLVEYRDDRTGLLVYPGGLMVEASDQLGRLHSQTRLDVTERFLAWARGPRLTTLPPE
ncbi:flavin reductase [Micromonospora purpureochromogenes]|uniref:flavin reductase n=1 Tax=Micromonospora purpureochromogenes TaxID=47872 RepID=UPI0033DCB476